MLGVLCFLSLRPLLAPWGFRLVAEPPVKVSSRKLAACFELGPGVLVLLQPFALVP